MKSTLTRAGRVTIPKALRDALKLRPGDRVVFLLGDDGIVRLLPAKRSVRNLKGMVPRPERPVTLDEMDVAVAHGAAWSESG